MAERELTEKELRRAARERFLRGRRAEAAFRRQLTSVSQRVDTIVKRYAPRGFAENIPGLTATLNQYAELLRPWARTVVARMHTDVSKRDAVSWMELAREMGGVLRKEIFTTPTGAIMREAMEYQVKLITSLPREAAIRVHKLTLEGIIQAGRAREVAAEIMRSGMVTKGRAMTIARTETSRTASLLLEARAQSIGSTHYRWHTVGDSDVRPEHRRLNGKTFRWDDPPIAGKKGEHANPGCIYNCSPGNMRVSLGNGIKHLWRVPYEGEVIDLIVGGELVSFTPNHPILTTRGWLPACEINKGHYVICFPDQVKDITESNLDHKLPRFDHLFDSFIENATLVPGAAFGFQFYGDTFQGDVNEISFERGLSGNWITALFEDICQLTFSEADRWILAAMGGGLSHIIESFFPSSGDQTFLLACRQFAHAHGISSASIAPFDPSLYEMASDYGTRNPILDRKSEFAQALMVFREKLFERKSYPIVAATTNNFNPANPEFLAENIGIAANSGRGIFEHNSRTYEACCVSDKIVRNLSGHVFTMETLSGWYDTTSTGQRGIVTRNCRCWAEPILPDEVIQVVRRPLRRAA